MADVIFYEKPGCINNTKQKALLETAGHRVDARNLLEHPWQPAELRRYFGDRPVAEWFNRAAPRVKSGEVVPEQVAEPDAIPMMLTDPFLIRRPLMQVAERYECGFDQDAVHAWIGLAPADGPKEDLQSCPQMGNTCP